MTPETLMSALYVILGIVPFSVLRYYPFRQKLRLKQGLFWCLYAGIVLMETVWFIGIEGHGTVLGVSDGELLRLIFYGVHLLLSCLVIAERVEKHLFVWCMNFIFSSTLTAFTNLAEAVAHQPTPHLAGNLAMLVLLPPFMALGFRFMRRTILPLLEHTGRRTGRLITAMLLVILAMGLVTTRELPFEQIAPLRLFFLRLTASLGGVSACLIFKSMVDEQQKILLLQQEHQQQETLLAISKEQFSALSGKIEEAKRARHDLKHHFTAIQSYLSQKDYDGLSAYVTEEEKSLPPARVLAFCDNRIINMVLSHYYDRAEAEGIPMEIMAAVPEGIVFPHTDTWVLLGNLLENALEGSLRITGGPRQIKVKIIYKGNFIYLSIGNRCNEAALIKTPSGYRSVKGGENCGNGLPSVSLLAEKHNGMADFEVKDGWFWASVFVQAP